jgi:rhodanese-related sulfurtransferase
MLYTFLAVLLVAAPLAAATPQTHKTEESMHKQIHADQFKSWYDQKKTMIVLDARSKPYFDGTLLPNAKWLPAESSEKEIQAAIPSKNSLVVVYCLGVECPASGWLYDKLTSMGYKNVYEYHEGLEDWIKRGFPITKQ